MILVDANLTDYDHEPKGQEFGCKMFENLPPIVNTEGSSDTISVNVLESTTKTLWNQKIIDKAMLVKQNVFCHQKTLLLEGNVKGHI